MRYGGRPKDMQTKEKNRISAFAVISVTVKVLLGALIALLVFVAAALAYDKYVKKSAIPSVFGKSLLVIATPSMSGSIDAGDAIIIEKRDSYEVGDVITYFPATDNVSVTHRIVRIEGEKYYAKGDANESEDPDPIFTTQIAGKMTKRIPKIGIIIEWLRTWQGIAFTLAVGAVVIALIMVAEQDDGEQPEMVAPESVESTTEVNGGK